MKKITIILKAIRAKSYIKNVFVLVPLFFSNNIFELHHLYDVLIMTISFCFMSSVVYLMNDLQDIEKDKLHYKKRFRPIASGEFPKNQAIALACFLLVVSIALTSGLPGGCIIVLGLYLLNNLLYTFKLKRIVLFDVYSIAVGFVLRVLAGAYAINVEISSYLLITILTLSLFLGFAKRYSEAKYSENNSVNTRQSLKDYSVDFLKNALWTMMSLTCFFYSLWTLDESVVSRIGNSYLIYTVPLVIMGFFEYINMLSKGREGDPVTVIYTNRRLLAIIIFFIIVIFFIIY